MAEKDNLLDELSLGFNQGIYYYNGKKFVEIEKVWFDDRSKGVAHRYKYLSIYQKIELEAMQTLSKHAYRVLCYLRATMGRGNVVRPKQRPVCKGASISAAYYANSISELLKHGFIIEGAFEGSYQVNPAFGYKGSVYERAAAASYFKRQLEGEGVRKPKNPE